MQKDAFQVRDRDSCLTHPVHIPRRKLAEKQGGDVEQNKFSVRAAQSPTSRDHIFSWTLHLTLFGCSKVCSEFGKIVLKSCQMKSTSSNVIIHVLNYP